jgi:hypothetical protein
MRTRVPFLLAVVLAAVAAWSPGPAAAIAIDAFTDPFPPSPCLPQTGAPVLFVGAYCDGVSCPPDPFAPCEDPEVAQSGLPGVAGGTRATLVTWDSGPVDVHARVRGDLGRLEVVSGGGSSSYLLLQYGSLSAPLALDLSADSHLAIEIGGDVSPALPLFIRVEMISIEPDGITLHGAYASAPIVSETGTRTFPFDSFDLLPGFSFAEVDVMRIYAGECPQAACDGPFPPRAWTIGTIRTDGGVVSTGRPSWGRLKTTYRPTAVDPGITNRIGKAAP